MLCQMCGKWFKKKKEIAKHMQKKHMHILVPCQRYQDSRHILENQTVPNYVMSFSNRAQRFTGSNYLDVDSPLPPSSSKTKVFTGQNTKSVGVPTEAKLQIGIK